MGDEDHDSRTIHCGNLAQDKITEEILYELFLQVCVQSNSMQFHEIVDLLNTIGFIFIFRPVRLKEYPYQKTKEKIVPMDS